jgi:hypothetical protein
MHSHKAVQKANVNLVSLRYKPLGRGFDSRYCHWNFSLTQFFWPHYGPGIDSASNNNSVPGIFPGGKGGRYVGLAILPSSCANRLEVWEPQTPGSFRAWQGL